MGLGESGCHETVPSANDMNFSMNHAPSAGLIAFPVDLPSNTVLQLPPPRIIEYLELFNKFIGALHYLYSDLPWFAVFSPVDGNKFLDGNKSYL